MSDAGAIKEAEALGGSGQFVHLQSLTGVLNALLLRSRVLTDPRQRLSAARA